MKTKSIKDAVHGYIKLDEPYWKIIDTPEFQRLKWLEQTSYRVLYPSARHDRFIHSIGTYHLGVSAINGFSENCKKLLGNNEIVEKYRESFLFACLLHDVGHSPFSHTCEDLYNYRDKVSNIESIINQKLLSTVENFLDKEEFEDFSKDYEYIINAHDNICKAPSEHEIMSIIVIMNNFATFSSGFPETIRHSLSKDLIIRSVIGCVYSVNHSLSQDVITDRGIKNCLIRLLNSSTVDVDKLDYIARDTMMSGYENIALDNERLLSSVSFVVKDEIYYPAFNKSALSVINNVILAKNSQSKWIVNHPIVIYEFYLLRKSIGISIKQICEDFYDDNQNEHFDVVLSSIFSADSLSTKVKKICNFDFSLLSDIDIIFLMKQNIRNKDVSEYFERNNRKHPIWKSHDEYLHCLGKESATNVADFFAPLINHFIGVEDLYHPKHIDIDFYNELKDEKTESISNRQEIFNILEVLKKYCDKVDADFDFVILPASNKFSAKINSKQLFIRFSNEDSDFSTYEELQNDAVVNQPVRYAFFYLYSKDKINSKDFLGFVKETINKESDFRC